MIKCSTEIVIEAEKLAEEFKLIKTWNTTSSFKTKSLKVMLYQK